MINCDRQSAQWLRSASQHNLTHNSIIKTTKILKRFTISIRLTAYTKDEAVGMAADNITSVEEATMATTIIAAATVAMATMAWTTVVMTTIAAIAITVAQTGEAYKKATVQVKRDIKAFNRRNATSATNQDAGLTSIP
jgi:hypothetical protein